MFKKALVPALALSTGSAFATEYTQDRITYHPIQGYELRGERLDPCLMEGTVRAVAKAGGLSRAFQDGWRLSLSKTDTGHTVVRMVHPLLGGGGPNEKCAAEVAEKAGSHGAAGAAIGAAVAGTQGAAVGAAVGATVGAVSAWTTSEVCRPVRKGNSGDKKK